MLNRHTRVGALLLLLLLFFVTAQHSNADGGVAACKAGCAAVGATCAYFCEQNNAGWPCVALCAGGAASCQELCDLPEPDPGPQQ